MNTAKEFRKVAEDHNANVSESSYNSCIEKISEAAHDGKLAVTIYDKVPSEVVDHLKAEGFTVEVMPASYRDTGHINIKW